EPEDESDVDSVLDEIKAVLKEEEKRLERLQENAEEE
ncbi:MAG TPA: serine protein kinase RIO, partial [Porticoccaceae bacterium]|nr:serine protein kinase RIO [Porticoccaceae bacterium]